MQNIVAVTREKIPEPKSDGAEQNIKTARRVFWTWEENEETPDVKVGCLLQLLLHLSVEDEGNDEKDTEHEEDEAGDGVDDLDDAEVRKVLSDFAKQYEKAL